MREDAAPAGEIFVPGPPDLELVTNFPWAMEEAPSNRFPGNCRNRG